MAALKIQITKIRNEIISELADLESEKLKEILDFIYFLKVKRSIDPSQAYFWTRRWQEMEKDADEDKRHRRIKYKLTL